MIFGLTAAAICLACALVVRGISSARHVGWKRSFGFLALGGIFAAVGVSGLLGSFMDLMSLAFCGDGCRHPANPRTPRVC
jgi:hypothetical protein